jgi:hypothetical protein
MLKEALCTNANRLQSNKQIQALLNEITEAWLSALMPADTMPNCSASALSRCELSGAAQKKPSSPRGFHD